MKVTRTALLASGLSLILCCALLMGATFAWFTDSVSNSGNIIQAGNLDISATVHTLKEVAYGENELSVILESASWTDVDTALMGVPAPYRPASLGTYCALGFADGKDLETDDVHFFDETNFEPGKSYAKLLRVTNNGSLAAKVTLSLSITEDGLTDALWFAVCTDSSDSDDPKIDRTPMGDFNTAMADVALQLGPKESADFLIAYGMNEEAGNDFQEEQFAADLNVLATQATYESDGFGSSEYDQAAEYDKDGDSDVIYADAAGLAAALTGAEPGAVIQLTEDADISNLTLNDPQLTLDLGQHTLTGSLEIQQETASNTVTVRNGTLKSDGAYSPVVLGDYAQGGRQTVVLENLIISNPQSGGDSYPYYYAIDAYGIYSVTLTNCTVTGSCNFTDAGSVTIQGGTYTAVKGNGDTALFYLSSECMTLSDGAVLNLSGLELCDPEKYAPDTSGIIVNKE